MLANYILIVGITILGIVPFLFFYTGMSETMLWNAIKVVVCLLMGGAAVFYGKHIAETHRDRR